MKRWRGNVLIGVILLGALLTTGIWARSVWVFDWLQLQWVASTHPLQNGGTLAEDRIRIVDISTAAGGVTLGVYETTRISPAELQRWRYMTLQYADADAGLRNPTAQRTDFLVGFVNWDSFSINVFVRFWAADLVFLIAPALMIWRRRCERYRCGARGFPLKSDVP